MHWVLPGCTYGCIPKVQGALAGHVVSPIPAVLEPRVHGCPEGPVSCSLAVIGCLSICCAWAQLSVRLLVTPQRVRRRGITAERICAGAHNGSSDGQTPMTTH